MNISPEWHAAIDDHLAWVSTSGAAATTLKLRRYHLGRLATEQQREPFAVTTDDLAHWFDQHTWSRSTIRSMRSTLRTFYMWAQRTGRIEESPAEALPKVAPESGRKREPASDIAVAWGLRATDPRVRLMVKLGARLGLRVGEVARSSREDVVADLVGHSMIVHGKGNKRRIVPLPADLARELLAMPPGHFFPGRDDGHLSPAHVSKMVSRALPVGETGHMLRHRRAARAYVQTGRDIRAVQELLGHASVATTQIYVPVEPEQLRLAVGGDL